MKQLRRRWSGDQTYAKIQESGVLRAIQERDVRNFRFLVVPNEYNKIRQVHNAFVAASRVASKMIAYRGLLVL